MTEFRCVVGELTEVIPNPPDTMEVLLANMDNRVSMSVDSTSLICVSKKGSNQLATPQSYGTGDIKIGDVICCLLNSKPMMVLGFDNG